MSDQIHSGEVGESKETIDRDARLAFALGVLGFLTVFIGGCIALGRTGNLRAWQSTFEFGLRTVGATLLVAALAFYARRKGRSVFWGGLGLLTWVGVIVLAVMPKVCRRCRARISSNGNSCNQCGAPA